MMLKLSTKYTKLGSSTGPQLCQNQGGSEDSEGKQDTNTGIGTGDQTYVPTQFGLHKRFQFPSFGFALTHKKPSLVLLVFFVLRYFINPTNITKLFYVPQFQGSMESWCSQLASILGFNVGTPELAMIFLRPPNHFIDVLLRSTPIMGNLGSKSVFPQAHTPLHILWNWVPFVT